MSYPEGTDILKCLNAAQKIEKRQNLKYLDKGRSLRDKT
jgi:hypothetical protein